MESPFGRAAGGHTERHKGKGAQNSETGGTEQVHAAAGENTDPMPRFACLLSAEPVSDARPRALPVLSGDQERHIDREAVG